MTEGHIRVGTSGWSYDHWSDVFYPTHLPSAKRLAFLASRFDTVEINSTFYHLPSERTVAAWTDTVPDGFVFAVKGSRLITHFHRLADVDDALATFMQRLSPLAEKLAVVLWQMPPSFSADVAADVAALGGFLDRLPPGVRHAVEFRHPSWLAEETFEVLRSHGVAQVHVSSDLMPTDLTPTADFVYVRLHGTSSYHGAYERPALSMWVDFLGGQAKAGRDGYVYFNNDAEGHAPVDAARLREMLGERKEGP